jgi:uncharacterized HAD superfamily protein
MKIGLDLDEVTAAFFSALLKHYHKKFGKLHKFEEFKEWKWEPVWGVSREEGIKIVDEFHEKHDLNEVQPLEHAANSLRHLFKDNELFIITSRPIRFKSKVEAWLKHHFNDIKMEVIHAGDWHKGQAATKAEICGERGIPLLIEDSPDTALECAKAGIRVILFDYPWNQKAKHKNIFRVRNWLEALEVIEHLKTLK